MRTIPVLLFGLILFVVAAVARPASGTVYLQWTNYLGNSGVVQATSGQRIVVISAWRVLQIYATPVSEDIGQIDLSDNNGVSILIQSPTGGVAANNWAGTVGTNITGPGSNVRFTGVNIAGNLTGPVETNFFDLLTVGGSINGNVTIQGSTSASLDMVMGAVAPGVTIKMVAGNINSVMRPSGVTSGSMAGTLEVDTGAIKTISWIGPIQGDIKVLSGDLWTIDGGNRGILPLVPGGTPPVISVSGRIGYINGSHGIEATISASGAFQRLVTAAGQPVKGSITCGSLSHWLTGTPDEFTMRSPLDAALTINDGISVPFTISNTSPNDGVLLSNRTIRAVSLPSGQSMAFGNGALQGQVILNKNGSGGTWDGTITVDGVRGITRSCG